MSQLLAAAEVALVLCSPTIQDAVVQESAVAKSRYEVNFTLDRVTLKAFVDEHKIVGCKVPVRDQMNTFQSALYSDLSFSSDSYRYGSFSTVRVAEVFREKLLVPCDENT
jgi:hypothetical protein